MELYSEGKSYTIYNGNMLDMLSEIKPQSIDAIVTDPPYEINFMGKSWDSAGVSFQKSTWEKCFDVLKPGGHILVFGGARTFHRIACAIEDAGFEIRDVIMWIYGSGFPKSMDIAKGIEAKLTTGSSNKKDFYKCNGDLDESKSKGYTSMKQTNVEQNYRDTNYESKGYLKLEPTTELAKQYQGWGSQLKPSYEPVIVARKPCDGTLVDNVIKYGVGGINIDECRVPFENTPNPATNPLYRLKAGYKTTPKTCEELGVTSFGTGSNDTSELGRFPADMVLTYDDTDFDEVCGGFPDTKSTQATGVKRNARTEGSVFDNNNCGFQNEVYDENRVEGFNDSGSAARYFYCAKTSKRDREEGLAYINGPKDRKNNHPTVKPTSLMQYLVKLVTPKGGTILDPFMGSGSTGKAVMYENADREANYQFVGIELDSHYCEIANARISFAEGTPVMLPTEERTDTGNTKLGLFDL